MPERLIHHLHKYIATAEEDRAEILSYFKLVAFNKKEDLITEGQLCRYNYFVLKGCLRMFFINDKGTEQTTQFAIENWWISDYFAFENHKAATFYIQAVERSQVLAIDHASLEKLLNRFPQVERYFRLVYQRAYSALQLRTKYFYEFSREEFYHNFNDKFPEFIQRVPQYLLASYLNMTPEYLSEIKNKRRS
ncbi:MAG: Crp/Fnr family transcriptional regulator [Sphingobacteriales bacterium]|nr:MAG: Crp/Fnr family transcriptional regulator [Sphingobacteriales bacterium]